MAQRQSSIFNQCPDLHLRSKLMDEKSLGAFRAPDKYKAFVLLLLLNRKSSRIKNWESSANQYTPLTTCSRSYRIHVRKWKHLTPVSVHSDFKIWKKRIDVKFSNIAQSDFLFPNVSYYHQLTLAAATMRWAYPVPDTGLDFTRTTSLTHHRNPRRGHYYYCHFTHKDREPGRAWRPSTSQQSGLVHKTKLPCWS